MPKVSFILPAYKRRFLREAIASILAQTYRDFELVVVDDCSPENLKSVADEFHDERMTYHRNETNIGGKDLVAAWNKALEYARGEWVVCAGDDDVYAPNYCEKMLSASGRYPQVDALHCRLAFIDENGELQSLGKPRAEYERVLEVVYHATVVRLDQRIPEFMFRRTSLLAHGGFADSPKAWYSDLMTACIMAQEHGSVFVDSFLVKWRLSGLNISSRFDDVPEKIEATVLFLAWLREFASRCVPDGEDEKLMYGEVVNRADEVALQSAYYFWSNVPVCEAMSILAESRLDDSVKAAWRRRRLYCEYGPGGIWRKLIGMFRG